MTVKKIIRDQLILSRKSNDATKQDIAVAFNLKDTLLANKQKAAGLAANMIGENKNIIVVFSGIQPIILINPKIIAKAGEYRAKEGCLSLLGEREAIRYDEISVLFYNERFEKEEKVFKGFVAEAIQHEIDHCQGILI
ncbi:MAG: peptide deformylase [Lactobacillus sp.]|nr:peptide deformylase [Lactobacillus sp.]